jgi:hypothetical protein
VTDADIRARAIAENGKAWNLLEKPDRSPAEDSAMIAAAKESLALWLKVGGTVNEQRGCWLVARTAVDAGEADTARQYSERTLALTAAHRDALADFDLAFAEEVAARTHALLGDTAAATRHRAEAERLGNAIAADGDRREFFRQFNRGPWFGLDDDGRG